MNLIWQKYDDFFRLYDQMKDVPRMFYVIGEKHHCYVGSVGGRGGTKGLRLRYQKQYVDRAMAIFGSSTPENQPAFAAIADDPRMMVSDMEPIERQIQETFIGRFGRENALFSANGEPSNFQLAHSGDIPLFLRL